MAATVASGAKGTGAAAAADIVQQKRQLRISIRRALRECSVEERQRQDAAIQSCVLGSDWFKNSERLCAYVSCAGLREVDTSAIIDHILRADDPSSQRKKLYVPRVKDRERHMQMLHIMNSKDLTPNSMNILEPSLHYLDSGAPRKDVMDADEPVDLLLLPGLGFDLSGRRLGRGGGYYDVFLQGLLDLNKNKGWRRPLLVALAYSPQIVDEVPVDGTDVVVDALVSSKGLLAISEYAKMRIA